ncbi:hypothetical protein ACHAXT_000009 [Thalassiosira profunda]
MQSSSRQRLTLWAGRAAACLYLVAAAVQLAVAEGLLPATIAWGGTQQRTPRTVLASAGAAAVLLGMALTVHRRAVTASPGATLRAASWIVALCMILNTLGNFLSSSPVERYVFGSATLVLAAASLIVACSPVVDEQGTYQSLDE